MKSLIFSILFFANLAAAQDETTVVSNPETPAIAETSAENLSPEKKNYARIFAGISFSSTDYNGTGFTATHPSTPGLGLGGMLEKELPETDFNWGFKFLHTDTILNTATGVTPGIVKYTRDEIMPYISMKPFHNPKWESTRVGVGYGLLKYTAEATSPNIVVTTQNTEGVSLLINDRKEINEKIIMSWGGALYLPYKFSEKEASSGHNPKYIGIELSFLFDRKFDEDLDIFAGIIYRRDAVDFDGYGDRGATSASDVRTTVFIPIGAKYEF